MEADEVEVFEMFGGGLPVSHHTVTVWAKGMGDRSHKPYGQMEYDIHELDECRVSRRTRGRLPR
ncbi:hypothetical protein [Paenibacillus senegalimassiliensis]|uniref:hypothetical protein n=1 Tax=Paenibacillus senegalimassiliensis TaxID=1737426 RepID=UPI00073F6D2F|nr:hypothetical protein [Paenibacillus senegalimassiliensis]